MLDNPKKLELEVLLKQNVHSSPAFQAMSALAMGRCLKAFNYTAYSASDVVFSPYDKADSLLIVLDGSVILQPSSSELPTKVLIPGNFIGQEFTRHAFRQATAVCSKDSIIGSLDKRYYFKALAQSNEHRLVELQNYLLSIPLFSGMSKREMAACISKFKEKKYKRNHVIYREGEFASHVFIVKEGEFAMSKQIKTTMPSQILLARKMVKSYNADIAILCQGEAFGENEVIQDTVRETTCKCYSNEGVLISVNREVFLTKLLKNPETLSVSRDIKQSYRSSRLSSLIEIVTKNLTESRSIQPSPGISMNPSKRASRAMSPIGKLLSKPQNFSKISPSRTASSEVQISRSPIKSQSLVSINHRNPKEKLTWYHEKLKKMRLPSLESLTRDDTGEGLVIRRKFLSSRSVK
mmetsp:Transcript_16821/g.30068  ORF Transcript_16821/g.30068 Transcript_16821/m.30068 type:complete len:408 (+) Transcript_16821:1628-2851(+)